MQFNVHSRSLICRINVQLVYSPHSVYGSKVYILNLEPTDIVSFIQAVVVTSMVCAL